MTPDGISTEDWNGIHELALLIVNTSNRRAKAMHKRRLLRELDRLEKKYGELPSILATRADYSTRVRDRIALLRRAYDLALHSRDERNALYISTSLADIYIEELKDKSAAKEWLRSARTHLAAGDVVDKSLCDDLEATIAQA